VTIATMYISYTRQITIAPCTSFWLGQRGMAHHLKQLPVCNAHSSYVFEVDVNSNSRDHAMSLSDDTFQHGIFSSLSLMDLIIFPLLTWQ
jgi:hypothetical protein